MAWRRLYACACVRISRCLVKEEDFKEAMRVLDMANMMCDDRSREMIEKEVRVVEVALRRTTEEEENNKKKRSSTTHIETQSPPKKRIKTVSLSGETIPRVSAPSLLEFKSKIIKIGRPVIVTDAMKAWPALKRWKDMEYLKRVAGHRTVPVEYGKHYMDSNWNQKLIRFEDFLRDHIYAAPQVEKAYLAQHRLFDQIPELAKDIMTPDYCVLVENENDDDVEINAWFGPEGTISNLHHDPKHNLLAQVVGQKYIRLYEQKYTSRLYPHDGLMSNTSQVVDVENARSSKEEKYPLFSDTPYYDCVLKPGEMLYIPPKVWHYVRSLETSFSVSFWWH